MAAAAPSGSASYKKKDGTLTVSKDHKSISWIPAAGGAGGALTLAFKNMTSMHIVVSSKGFSYLTKSNLQISSKPLQTTPK
jgi:hypothetical protein